MAKVRAGVYLLPLLFGAFIACEGRFPDPPGISGPAGSAGQGSANGGQGGRNTGTGASSGSSGSSAGVNGGVAAAGGSGGGTDPGGSGSAGDSAGVDDAGTPDGGADASDGGSNVEDAGVDSGTAGGPSGLDSGTAGGPSSDAGREQIACARSCVRRSDFCEAHTDCAPGQYCDGSCKPGAALHEPCASGSFCGAGLVCDSGLGTCEPLALDADCGLISPSPCAAGLVCARTPLDATPHCRLPAAAYDYCFFGEIPCQAGLWCDTFFEGGMCLPRTALGTECIAVPCVSGADCTLFEESCGESICLETRCAEMPGDGLPCKPDCYFLDDCGRCGSGLYCDQEICRALAELGDDCSERVCGEGLRCIDSPTGLCNAPN